MKKIVFGLIIAFIFSSCTKCFKCTGQFDKTSTAVITEKYCKGDNQGKYDYINQHNDALPDRNGQDVICEATL